MKRRLIAILAILAATAGIAQAQITQPGASPVPFVKPQFSNAAGAPLAAGKLYFYVAGTSTDSPTYTTSCSGVDLDMCTENAQPVVLDAGGRASIFLGPSCYKIVAQNAGGVEQWTVDNICDLAQLLKLSFATQLDDKVCHASQYDGATGGAKLAACYAVLPSTGGTIDARGLEGAQSSAQDFTAAGSKPYRLLLGAATWTLSTAAWRMPSGSSVEGLGRGITSIVLGNNVVGLSVRGTGINIAGLTFTLNAGGGTTRAIQFDAASRDVYVDNCDFDGNSSPNANFGLTVSSQDLTNLYVTRSRFTRMSYAIIKDNADTSVTTNTVFDNILLYDTVAGINVNHPAATGSWTGIKLSNITCDTAANNGWCIGLSGVGVLQAQISNFTAVNCAQECIHIEDLARIISINGGSIIKKNTTVADHGLIHIITGAQDIVISGFDFNMTHPSDGSTGYGVYVTSGGSGNLSSGITIANNTFVTKANSYAMALGDSYNVKLANNTYRNPDTADKASFTIDISGTTGTITGDTFYAPAVLYKVNANTFVTSGGIFIDGELTGFDFLTGKPTVYDSIMLTSFSIHRSFTADASATNNVLFPVGTIFSGKIGAKFVPSSGAVQWIVTGDTTYDGTTLYNTWQPQVTPPGAPGDLTGFYRSEIASASGGSPGLFTKTGANVTLASGGTAGGNVIVTFSGQYFR